MNFNWDVSWPAVLTAVSVLVASTGVYIAWRGSRDRQLRLDDVLRWSNDVIRTLQTLYLLSTLGERQFGASETQAMRKKIVVDTSVLVEQGRLFFKNQQDPTKGREKLPAYRGYRAEILDPIVVAHQIACRWDGADEATRRKMALVAEDSVRRFVSMAQQEIGRSETQSEATAKGGKGDSLDDLMQAVEPSRLAQLDKGPKASL